MEQQTSTQEPSLVQQMIGEKEPAGTISSIQKTDDKAPGLAAEQQTATQPTDDPIEQLILKFAKQEGRDPNDPNQRKLLEKLAEAEIEIFSKREQRNKVIEQMIPSIAGQFGLDVTKPEDLRFAKRYAEKELERSRKYDEVKPPPSYEEMQQLLAAEQQQTQANSVQDQTQQVKIGENWRDPADAMAELTQAWSEASQKGDYSKAAQIFFTAVGMAAEARLSQIPELSHVREQQRLQQNLQSVFVQVNQNNPQQAQEFASLMKPDQDGRSILSQIQENYPFIANIFVQHPDPDKAMQLTIYQRLAAAANLAKAIQSTKSAAAPSIDPKAAAQLLDAGKKMAARSAVDEARQTLNAGGTASVAGDTGASGSYISALSNLPGERSLSSVFKQ